MENQKKAWSTPDLTEYGTVADLTLGADPQLKSAGGADDLSTQVSSVV